VSGAQLIDPTLILAPDLAVFFSPGVIPSWSEKDGLENELFQTFAFLGSARTEWGTQDTGRLMKLPGIAQALLWQESFSTRPEEVSARLTHERQEKSGFGKGNSSSLN